MDRSRRTSRTPTTRAVVPAVRTPAAPALTAVAPKARAAAASGRPVRPARMPPAYDSGDHLYSDDARHQAIAHAIGLRPPTGGGPRSRPAHRGERPLPGGRRPQTSR